MSELKIVKDWSIKRSGAGMTLAGKSNNCPVRVPDIKTVSMEGGSVLAQTKGGEIFVLHTGGR